MTKEIPQKCKVCRIERSSEHDKTCNILIRDFPVVIFQCNDTGLLTGINPYGKTILGITDADINKLNILQKLKLNEIIIQKIQTTTPYDVTKTISANSSTVTLIIKLVKSTELENTIKGVCFNDTKEIEARQRLAELSNCFINFTPNQTSNIKKLISFIKVQLGCDYIYYQRSTPHGYITIDEQGKNFNVPECVIDFNTQQIKQYKHEVPFVKIDTDTLGDSCRKKINNDKSSFIIKNILYDGIVIGQLMIFYEDKSKLNNDLSWLIQIISSSIEMEERKYYDTKSLHQANKILSATTELTASIFSTNIINLSKILQTIGEHLSFDKVYLVKFPKLFPYYVEWTKPNKHTKEELIINDDSDYDIISLMEWMRNGETTCINTLRYSSKFKPLVHNAPEEHKYKFLTPILINNKPWGVLCIDETRIVPSQDIIRATIMNMGKILSLIIKEKEEQDEIDNRLFKQMTEFKKNSEYPHD